MKAYWGSSGIALLIPKFGTTCRCGRLHVLSTLPPGKEPRYPSNRRLDGPRTSSGWSLLSARIRTQPNLQLFAVPTALSRLRFSACYGTQKFIQYSQVPSDFSYIKGHRMVWSVKELYFLCKCKTSVRNVTFEVISLHWSDIAALPDDRFCVVCCLAEVHRLCLR